MSDEKPLSDAEADDVSEPEQIEGELRRRRCIRKPKCPNMALPGGDQCRSCEEAYLARRRMEIAGKCPLCGQLRTSPSR
jgi:hypothetical protein